MYVLELYEIKLRNYSCFSSALPNFGMSWGISKLRNYACLACMYEQFIHFYIVKQLSLLCKYVYEKVKKQNYKTTLDSIDIVNILKIYDPKLWNYTCLWCVQPNLGRRWVLFKLQNYACFACMYQKFIWSNLVNYETTLVFEICCQIIGRDEGYPNYETTPVLHICTENLDILYT